MNISKADVVAFVQNGNDELQVKFVKNAKYKKGQRIPGKLYLSGPENYTSQRTYALMQLLKKANNWELYFPLNPNQCASYGCLGLPPESAQVTHRQVMDRKERSTNKLFFLSDEALRSFLKLVNEYHESKKVSSLAK